MIINLCLIIILQYNFFFYQKFYSVVKKLNYEKILTRSLNFYFGLIITYNIDNAVKTIKLYKALIYIKNIILTVPDFDKTSSNVLF